LIPIVWSTYVNKVQRYQGALQDKALAFSHFLKETEVHDEDVDYQERFPELAVLWEHIFDLLTPSDL
jgi:hypothetical protein